MEGPSPNSLTSFPPPPVFGFSRDDSINLEDIFTDWFNEDNLNGPPAVVASDVSLPPGVGASQQQHGGRGLNVSQFSSVSEQINGDADDVSKELEVASSNSTSKASNAGRSAGPGRKKRPRGGSSSIGPSLSVGPGAGGGGGGGRRMTEEQKVERRERNREHAKRSRVRKKFLLESLQKSVTALQEENDKLRSAIRGHLKGSADDLLKACVVEPEDSLLTSDPSSATKILDDPDYTLVKALQTAQQNFVITDPTLPDNPIVYASGGFLSLTGYSMDQILGRNCRFLQGPDTDPAAVDKIRRAIEDGSDGSVCLLNYRADGSTFWNQFFIAALRGADGNVVNYVGVQCKVSEEYAREVLRKESEMGGLEHQHPPTQDQQELSAFDLDK